MNNDKEILHSKRYGEDKNGVPLLVFHGLFGMLDNWGSFGREYSEMFPIHLIDLRNHGRSFHSPNMSHEDLANDILNYMNHYQMQKVNLLGHSLGGKAVMQFAIENPDKVNKLIVVDIAPKAYPPHHQAIIKALQTVNFEVMHSRQEVESHLKEYIKENSVVQFLAKNLFWQDQPKQLQWRFNLNTLAEKYSQFVGKEIKYGVFQGKTLFIKGQKSNYILPQDEFPIKQQFPNSQIAEVKHAGHWVQAENPKDFAQEVIKFLNP